MNIPVKQSQGEKKLVAPRKFADTIAESLRIDIEGGMFKPGDRLPTESELAATYGVSRAVIREALTALRHDEVVESFQGKGIFVSTGRARKAFRLAETNVRDDKQLQDVLEFMIANDVAAAGLAASRRSKSQLAEIRKALVAMGKAIEKGNNGIEEDVAFHKAIVAATDNPCFISFHAFLEDQVRYVMRETRLNSQRAGWTDLVQVEHERIYEAIARGDAAAASAAAEAHLRNAAARLKASRSENAP
jgi:DNA-binding FadR family transcriptional regulator